MPSYLAHQDEVFVGRVRKDLFEENVVHFWVVADNILKGAALNSVQIAYYMHRHGSVSYTHLDVYKRQTLKKR